jgi:carbamoyl-phosphate synthase/aspartate carbamoyltransferase/dihydroorotase
MTNIRLPGLIDIHVHLREPGASHKEDWLSGTSAALAGGFTAVLAMPNTKLPITNQAAFETVVGLAEQKAVCDYGQYLGAGPENAAEVSRLAGKSAGLKMYLDSTYGELKLDSMEYWQAHFEHWPVDKPIAAHAETTSLASIILLSDLYDRPVHLCHVSRKQEMSVIRKAKDKGLKITCEVTPHHLFLSQEDIPKIGQGRHEVRPVLNTPEDQKALWDSLEYIDCFATDHAPHTLAEKDSDTPPPGFPGLETILPLLLSAVHEGRLTIEDITRRLYDNPRSIFNIRQQPETYIEVDPEVQWTVRAAELFSKCGWTPFEGRQLYGKVDRVVLRGEKVYESGKILVKPGSSQNLF